MSEMEFSISSARFEAAVAAIVAQSQGDRDRVALERLRKC